MLRVRTAVSFVLALVPLTAFAQATPLAVPAPAAPNEPEIIVVTAQRREQDLQDVPVSVTALQASDLEAIRVGNFSDIGYAIPNLSTNLQLGASTTPAYAIRGVTSGLLSFSVDSGVGLYLDGVYVARSAGSAFDLADLERVEVLRGPQGILWGKNTTGGAINFVTAKPDEAFGIKQTLTGGNFGAFRSRTTLNSGEWNGFSARVTYLHSQQDGYVDNLARGVTLDYGPGFGSRASALDFGRENTEALLAALHYESDAFRADYKFDVTHLDSTQQAVQAVGTSDGAGGGFAGLILALQPTVGGTNLIARDRRGAVPNEMMTPSHLEVWGNSLTLEYDITEDVTLKSITAFRDLKEDVGGNDIDGNRLFNPDLSGILGFNLGPVGAPLPIITSIQNRRQHQWQQEVQVIGETGPFEWIAGFFYFDEKGHDDNPLWIFQPFPGGAAPPTGGTLATIENRSIAVYGSGTFNFLDNRAHLTGGVRQTWDRRDWSDPIPAVTRLGGKLSNTDWSVTAGYDVLENANLYYKVGTSFLSGGFLNGVEFKEEQLLAHELGAKTSWWDNRITFNIAGFFEEYQDLQVPVFNGVLQVFNAGKAEISGVELEGRFEPFESLDVSYGFGHQHFKFLVFEPGGPGTGNRADTARRTNAPDNTANLAVTYTLPEFSFGRASGRIDADWRDDVNFLLFPVTGDLAANGASRQDAHWQLSTRLALDDIPLGDRVKLGVALWTQNLLNEKEPGFSADLGTVVVSKFMKPRSYGVDVTLEF